MKAMKLTQSLIKSLKPQVHTYSVWDSQVPTLGVRVCHDNQRFYIMRTPNGSQKIASVGQVSLKTARQHALKTFKASLEPSGNKSGRLIRFDALVRDEWIDKVMMNWKPTSQGTGRSALKCHLLKAFGRYPFIVLTLFMFNVGLMNSVKFMQERPTVIWMCSGQFLTTQ